MRTVNDKTAINKLSVVIQIVVIAFLKYLTLMPVEIRWAQADLLLIRMIPSICVLGGLMLLLRREKVCVTVADLLLTLFALYYGYNSWKGTEYPCATQCLKVASIFLLYIVLRMLFSARNVSQWVMVAILLLCGSIEAIWGIIQLAGGGNPTQVYLISGNFLNPGPYSAYLTIGAVTGLAVLADKGRSRVVFTVVALMLTVLPSTWSRAAFITVGLLMLWLFRAKQCRYRFLVWGIFVVIAAAVYFAKKGSADGRLVIWTATILSWRHCPLTGVGTGGFAHGCSEGIAEMYNSQILPSFLDSAGVADNAFNVFLKILIEQGLVGLILFAMILVVFIKGLYSSSRPLFYGMLGLIIFSMFSYPLEQLPYRIIAVMIAAWSESNRKQTISFWGTKIITVLAFILTIMAGMFIREEAYNRFRADKDAKMLSCQKSEDLIDDFFELLPLEEDNPQFLYDFAMTLSENGRFNDSNTILSKGCMISADPMFYVLKGNNYYSMNQPYQAEKTYVKAFSVLPNRIYPLYKLMLLYSETGQDYKALMMAKAIIDIKPKVESPATEEMKEKAHRVLSE